MRDVGEYSGKDFSPRFGDLEGHGSESGQRGKKRSVVVYFLHQHFIEAPSVFEIISS